MLGTGKTAGPFLPREKSLSTALAALPFLHALSDKTGWYSHADLANILAVSESTPGPIGINMATYIGFTVAGVWGSLLASTAYVLPSLVIGVYVARFLAKFKANPYVTAVFYGIRPAVCGLIGAAAYIIINISILDTAAFRLSGAVSDLFQMPAVLLFAVIMFMHAKGNRHPLFYIAIAAVAGVLLKL